MAQTKTKRFPAISTYLFASGDITSPTFNFPAGSFGFDKPQKFKLSTGITGYASVQAAQPISQLYQIHLAIREQELSVDYSGEQYKGKRQSTGSECKAGLLRCAADGERPGGAAGTGQAYEETDRVATQYLTQESVLKSDSLQVKAKLAQARYQIIQLRDTLDTQKEQLNELLGRDIDIPFRTERASGYSRGDGLKAGPANGSGAAAGGKGSGDRYPVAPNMTASCRKAKYIPDVGAAIHYLDPINTEILPQNIVSAGMELKWDPFDWGGRRDEVKQKDVSVQQSHYQLQETKAQVTLDVDNNFRKLEESRRMLGCGPGGQATRPMRSCGK